MAYKSSKFKRIAIGLSGGIDSAISALLLKRKKFDVIGVFMKNWDSISEDDKCEYDKDIEDAQWVCNKLQIPFHEVNFVKEYWNHVFQPMIDDYVKGLTPNPDLWCNSKIKFDAFFNHCHEKLNADAIATGHYVRSSYGTFLENYNPEVSVKLLKGVDDRKDQSFFLSRISQNALQKSMFPVGSLTKSQVKEIAAHESFDRILKRKESMGICFIGKRNFRQFMATYVPSRPGRFIEVDTGKVVGRHDGIHLWTIGQRAGIAGFHLPHYVVFKDANSGDIYVASGDDNPALFSHAMLLSDEHWITEEPKTLINDRIIRCEFRFLHRKPLQYCSVLRLSENNLLLDADKPIYVASPGQFAVFYNEDECLGSAKINSAVSSFS